MKIGLYDVDSKDFPNLPLMKISAYHKAKGDDVEFINFWEHYDKVYVSKVFGDEYSQMDMTCINADEIIYGGTGFAITVENGKEVYHEDKDKSLPYEIEHMYPDYSLYPELTKDMAYGFLTRGCPNNCSFCIVSSKEGRKTYKVANLSEFWNGQRYIKLLDANILACKEHKDLLLQLIQSKAYVGFTQGLDIRLTNEENISLINQLKVKQIHFAWDNAKVDLKPYFERYRQLAKHKPHGDYGTVYCLVNFNSTMEENLYRIYTLRDMGFQPYVMIYDKPNAPEDVRLLQRWCNNIRVFRTCPDFNDFDRKRA